MIWYDMLVLALVIVLTLTAKYICFATIATSSRMRVTGTLNSLSPSSYSILNEPSSLIHAQAGKKRRSNWNWNSVKASKKVKISQTQLFQRAILMNIPPTDALDNWLMQWQMYLLTDFLSHFLSHWLADWLTDTLTDWYTEWLTHWLTEWLTD